MSKPPRITPKHFTSEILTDPAEIAASEERSRRYKTTAAGQVGCWMVIDAPLPLLAQYIIELPADERELFLGERIARLPPEVLTALAESLRSRAAANGAGALGSAVADVAV